MNVAHKILVIDDDKDNHRFLSRVLGHEGYDVMVASSGLEGLQLLKEFKPDLIVLDINMPGMNGLQTLKLLKQKEEFVAVIFLTGNSDTEDIIRGLDAGALDYICKPFNPHELAARIRCQLRVKKLHDDLRDANRKLQGLVDIDDLTGLYNMRSIYDKINNEIERARRYQHGLAVIMMDMDNFKYVNDGHNHLFGSFVLAEVGKIIKHTIRTIDFAARYGGDEFLICLSRTTTEGAIKFAERLKAAICKHEFVQDNDRKFLTASFGVAILDSGKAIVDARTITRIADSKLYDAKGKGRDRVESQIILSDEDVDPRFLRKVI